MVRRTTRISALQAAEKVKKELTPRRSRRKRAQSTSSSSADEVLSNVALKQQTTSEHEDSSDNSDYESKKPLKKRQTRSKTAAKKQNVRTTRKASQLLEAQQEDEVTEDNSEDKGKSNSNDNSDVVVAEPPPPTADTETENMQVTDESPETKDDNSQNEDDVSKNGAEASVIDVNISESLVAEMSCDNRTTEITSEETTEITITEHSPIKAAIIEEDSKELTQTNWRISILEDVEMAEPPQMDIEQTKEVVSETKQNVEESPATDVIPIPAENTRKLRLHRRPIEASTKGASPADKENDNHVVAEIKTSDAPEESVPAKATEDSKQDEKDNWESTYETTQSEKTEGKRLRRKITLKRPTLEESPKEKQSINVERSVSMPEEKTRNSHDNIVIEKKERRRTVSEITSENEDKVEKPKKPSQIVKLKRELPEPRAEQSSEKKYVWTRSDIAHLISDPIEFDSLQSLIPDIQFLNEEDVNLELTTIEKKTPEKLKRKTFKELEDEEMENIQAELDEESEDGDVKDNILAANRRISIVEGNGGQLKPPQSPAKNPLSEVLFITNLVRPFTVKQLKDLLERTGKIKEDGIWTDRIKSKCYVCYETIEEAEATRNALHGIHWPIGNGKKLVIDYATIEDMENAKNPPPPPIVQREKSPEKENKIPEEREEPHHKDETKASKREWDIGKESIDRERSRSREGDRKRQRRSFTPDGHHHHQHHKSKEEPIEQKAMDDLFLKTKGTPSIYWKPLSPEEITEKQQQRQARLDENKRRLEEIKTSGRGGRDRGGRDRNFKRR